MLKDWLQLLCDAETGAIRNGFSHHDFVCWYFMLCAAKKDDDGRLVAEVFNREIEDWAKVSDSFWRDCRKRLEKAGLITKLPHRHGRGKKEGYILNVSER